MFLLNPNSSGGSGGSSPLTTKGDIFGFSTVDARIPVGANATFLVADSTQTLGVKYFNLFGTTNTFSATQTILKSALGATTTDDALVADNTTAATSTVPQVSPAFRWRGRAWNSGASLSKTIDFRAWVLSSASNIFPSGTWKLQQSVDGGAYTDLFEVDGANAGLGVVFTPPT